ncbi:MbnP family copper-binding protein [Chitinimonas lacunae]|uniref:MbnP family copper-binding protein n=1 Tax=Chitinimonas lacunae TaxID=1963018 RepID=A0ABV8MKH9_9NEIS
MTLGSIRPYSLLLGLALAGVPAQADMADRAVTLRFAASLQGRPFVCGQRYEQLGRTGAALTATDLRFYVSSVALLKTDGRSVPLTLEQDGVWQHEDVALLDFEHGEGACRNGTPGRHEAISGRVPAGDYRGLRFTLGLSPARNHADVTLAPSPLNLTAMFWSWQGGYRFLKLELVGQGRVGFPVHLGSTGCQSGSATEPASRCSQPNRVEVELPQFDPESDVVGVDLSALLAQTRLDRNWPGSPPGCMSGSDDPDCHGILAALGLKGGAMQRLFVRLTP